MRVGTEKTEECDVVGVSKVQDAETVAETRVGVSANVSGGILGLWCAGRRAARSASSRSVGILLWFISGARVRSSRPGVGIPARRPLSAELTRFSVGGLAERREIKGLGSRRRVWRLRYVISAGRYVSSLLAL